MHRGASLVVFLFSRGTSGERAEERGCSRNKPPLPSPLLHPMEEREGVCAALVQTCVPA
jgi:hypothetical protein